MFCRRWGGARKTEAAVGHEGSPTLPAELAAVSSTKAAHRRTPGIRTACFGGQALLLRARWAGPAVAQPRASREISPVGRADASPTRRFAERVPTAARWCRDAENSPADRPAVKQSDRRRLCGRCLRVAKMLARERLACRSVHRKHPLFPLFADQELSSFHFATTFFGKIPETGFMTCS